MLEQFRAAGLKLESKFYPEARHELLNETNRDEVTADLIRWLGTVADGFNGTRPLGA
jgi:alpha-beta hydrolase superfamily lysophospholipase